MPTNDAVTKLLAQVSNAGYTLAASTLSVIVGEHIIKGAYHEEELSKVAQDPVGTITSSIGEKVIPYIKDDMTYLKGESTAGLPTAKIVSKEILLANGCVAYSVDQAIIPSNAILVKSLSATTPTIPK